MDDTKQFLKELEKLIKKSNGYFYYNEKEDLVIVSKNELKKEDLDEMFDDWRITVDYAGIFTLDPSGYDNDIYNLEKNINKSIKDAKLKINKKEIREILAILDDDILESNLKQYFYNKVSEDENSNELESLISIIKNPYQGKYATEISYEDAVIVLKDKYDYTDEMIEDLKNVVTNENQIKSSI